MYKVVKTERCIAQLQVLGREFDRMSELNKAIDWYLQRRPGIYAIEIEPRCFLWVTDQLPYGFPVLKILYKVDDVAKTVKIISISRDESATLSSQ